MKLKLISEILEGFAFHYYGNEKRVYIKLDKNKALTPERTIRRMSKNTLVVPHEGKKNDK